MSRRLRSAHAAYGRLARRLGYYGWMALFLAVLFGVWNLTHSALMEVLAIVPLLALLVFIPGSESEDEGEDEREREKSRAERALYLGALVIFVLVGVFGLGPLSGALERRSGLSFDPAFIVVFSLVGARAATEVLLAIVQRRGPGAEGP